MILSYMQFELNWIAFQYVVYWNLNTWIWLKKNGMQIGGESIENLLRTLVLKTKLKENIDSKIHILMSFIWQQFKQIPIWNCPNDNLQLMKPKVVLLKPTPLNHCH